MTNALTGKTPFWHFQRLTPRGSDLCPGVVRRPSFGIAFQMPLERLSHRILKRLENVRQLSHQKTGILGVIDYWYNYELQQIFSLFSFCRSARMLGVGECPSVLGQLAGMEASRGSLYKVAAVLLKAEKLGPILLGVKEVMFEWFSLARRMSGHRVMRRTPSPFVINIQYCKYLLMFSVPVLCRYFRYLLLLTDLIWQNKCFFLSTMIHIVSRYPAAGKCSVQTTRYPVVWNSNRISSKYLIQFFKG